MSKRKRTKVPEKRGNIDVSEVTTKEATLLVARMISYRLEYIMTLERQINREIDHLHNAREPEKMIGAYNRVMKMTKTIGALTIEDKFDAFHLQVLINKRKKASHEPERPRATENIHYIN